MRGAAKFGGLTTKLVTLIFNLQSPTPCKLSRCPAASGQASFLRTIRCPFSSEFPLKPALIRTQSTWTLNELHLRTRPSATSSQFKKLPMNIRK